MAVILAATQLGANISEILNTANSGDVTGDRTFGCRLYGGGTLGKTGQGAGRRNGPKRRRSSDMRLTR